MVGFAKVLRLEVAKKSYIQLPRSICAASQRNKLVYRIVGVQEVFLIMTTFKKLAAALVIGAAAFTLSACAAKTDAPVEGTQTAPAATEAAPAEGAATEAAPAEADKAAAPAEAAPAEADKAAAPAEAAPAEGAAATEAAPAEATK